MIPPNDALVAEMTGWRRDFHRHPEPGFAEARTAARIAELLEGFGLRVERGIGGTGVVGVLERGGGGRAIGLRADMDALPITEATGLDYASAVPGTMHACGHDGHTAMLLGAAAHLAREGRFSGRVVCIFQPAEEHGQGARAMIDAGLFERHPVDMVFGLHNMPGLPVGTAALRPGPMTAAESLFEIVIQGQGGHAAMPHMGADAITIGAQVVNALQTIVSRKLDPGLNGVVSVTEFITDGGRNVLPGRAVLRGDARALTPGINAQIEARMRQIVQGVCAAHGASASVSYDTVFAPVLNDPAAVRAAAAAAEDVFGASSVDAACAPKLFSEDFAHVAAQVPGCFLLLGNGTEGAHARPLHASDYDFNDAGLGPGAAFWSRLVERELT